MTVTIELEPEVEARLTRKAQQEGKDVTTFLQSLIEREAQGVKESEGSAYDLFAERLGGIRSGGQGRWSENTGEKFAEGVTEKRRRGHL